MPITPLDIISIHLIGLLINYNFQKQSLGKSPGFLVGNGYLLIRSVPFLMRAIMEALASSLILAYSFARSSISSMEKEESR